MKEMMKEMFVWFVCLEFGIGVCATCWFVAKKILFPVIDFIVDYWSSYGEFKKWRKCHG